MSDDKTESDVAFIRALAAILKDSDLNEIELRREYGEGDEMKVRLTKQGPMTAPMQAAAMPMTAPAPVAAPAAPPPPPVHAAAPEAPADAAVPAAGAMPSPMVGTAYLSPEPGAPTFVAVGDTVTEGQTILIIEAMKTMNQIASPRDGTVRAMLVGDGDPVEFGMPLAVIE